MLLLRMFTRLICFSCHITQFLILGADTKRKSHSLQKRPQRSCQVIRKNIQVKTKISKAVAGRPWQRIYGMEKNKVNIRRGSREIHRDQSLVERFSRTLAEILLLFGYQYAKELENPHKRNREWIKRLPNVIKSINVETKKNSPFCNRKS